MSKVLPNSRAEMIDWFIERIAYWNKDPASIGLTAAQVADLANRLSAAESDLETATTARIDSKQATLNYYTTSDDLRNFGGDLIKTIRTFAETNDDPSVFALAEIPEPSPPTPAGPPEQPTELSAKILLPFGLGLAWKGSVAQGAYFGIWRRIDGESDYTLIATSKDKNYDDQTLPAGTATVSYYISAHRDSFTVNGAGLTIQIGTNGNMSLSMAA